MYYPGNLKIQLPSQCSDKQDTLNNQNTRISTSPEDYQENLPRSNTVEADDVLSSSLKSWETSFLVNADIFNKIKTHIPNPMIKLTEK